jgi:hypothetical protein
LCYLLRLQKKSKLLTRAVHKQALLRASQDFLHKKRFVLWQAIANFQLNQDFSCLEKIARNTLSKQTAALIRTDIKRSFVGQTGIDEKVLERILFPLAVVEPDRIKYTQGMNFVAGFLYLSGKDEQWAFQLMRWVIDQNVFETAQLAKEFQLLDRLIKVKMP